ncbi:MAG TPA: ribosome recycling factor [Bacteroidales bacterium]|nr:ribosome recycling factor [Bacteroidales bacterium]
MDEELTLLFEDAEERIEKALNHLKNELLKLRAGKADIHILDGVMVDYYGTLTPLTQVSNINTPDPRTISIQPWEKKLIPIIEKAILEANIGLNPDNNGELIRLFVPPLTEERRKDLVKKVKQEGENSKVSIRNIRRDVLEELKKLQKDGLSEDIVKTKEKVLQDLINNQIQKIDEITKKKEMDIMTI